MIQTAVGKTCGDPSNDAPNAPNLAYNPATKSWTLPVHSAAKTTPPSVPLGAGDEAPQQEESIVPSH